MGDVVGINGGAVIDEEVGRRNMEKFVHDICERLPADTDILVGLFIVVEPDGRLTTMYAGPKSDTLSLLGTMEMVKASLILPILG